MVRTEDYRNQVLELYRQYGNGGRVAKELGITNYRVYKCLRENGIEPKPIGGKEKHSAEKICSMYASGMSTIEIASQLDMSDSSVWERIKNHGEQYGVRLRSHSEACENRGHTHIRSDQEQYVIDQYQSGWSAQEIADELELDYKDTVLRVLHKHDIELRDTRGANHPNWKGGRLNINKLIRNSSQYIGFRDRMFAKHNYTCQITNQRGGILNMHHIRPMSELIDEFVTQHGEDIGEPSRREEFFCALAQFEPFWDEDNILVITEEQHKRIHTAS